MKGINSMKVFWAALLLLTMSFAQGVSARTPERIQFAKGKSSATVQARTGTEGVTYVVRAMSGQKLILKLKPASGIGIKVETDGREGQTVLLREEKGGTFELGLDESGDYYLFVGSVNHQSLPFTLTIKITNLADV